MVTIFKTILLRYFNSSKKSINFTHSSQSLGISRTALSEYFSCLLISLDDSGEVNRVDEIDGQKSAGSPAKRNFPLSAFTHRCRGNACPHLDHFLELSC